MAQRLIVLVMTLAILRKSAVYNARRDTENKYTSLRSHTPADTHEIAQHSWNGKSESCFSLLGKLPPSPTSHEATDCAPQLLSDDSMLCHACAISAWVNCLAPGWPAAPSEIPPPYCWWRHLLPATLTPGNLAEVVDRGCRALLFPRLKGPAKQPLRLQESKTCCLSCFTCGLSMVQMKTSVCDSQVKCDTECNWMRIAQVYTRQN